MSYDAADYAGLPPQGIPRATTYEILEAEDSPPAIRCLRCGFISANPNDVGALYCGACHRFHEDV